MITITQFDPTDSDAEIKRKFGRAFPPPPQGEMALDAYARHEREEQAREDFYSGDMSIEEAYDMGLIDALGFEEYP